LLFPAYACFSDYTVHLLKSVTNFDDTPDVRDYRNRAASGVVDAFARRQSAATRARTVAPLGTQFADSRFNRRRRLLHAGCQSLGLSGSAQDGCGALFSRRLGDSKWHQSV
jgi:hypothetical protein